jgi:hypothetical protein
MRVVNEGKKSYDGELSLGEDVELGNTLVAINKPKRPP